MRLLLFSLHAQTRVTYADDQVILFSLVGWRWIFILEGIFTVLMGIYAFWGMAGLPEDATFLSETERKQVLTRLEVDREGQNTHYSIDFVKQGFKDWKSYLFAVVYLGLVVSPPDVY